MTPFEVFVIVQQLIQIVYKGRVPHLSSADCGENIKASRGLGTSISQGI